MWVSWLSSEATGKYLKWWALPPRAMRCCCDVVNSFSRPPPPFPLCRSYFHGPSRTNPTPSGITLRNCLSFYDASFEFGFTNASAAGAWWEATTGGPAAAAALMGESLPDPMSLLQWEQVRAATAPAPDHSLPKPGQRKKSNIHRAHLLPFTPFVRDPNPIPKPHPPFSPHCPLSLAVADVAERLLRDLRRLPFDQHPRRGIDG